MSRVLTIFLQNIWQDFKKASLVLFIILAICLVFGIIMFGLFANTINTVIVLLNAYITLLVFNYLKQNWKRATEEDRAEFIREQHEKTEVFNKSIQFQAVQPESVREQFDRESG